MHAASSRSSTPRRSPTGARLLALLATAVAVVLLPRAASAWFHDKFFQDIFQQPPPPPSLTMVCDKGRIPPGYQYENLRAARVCPNPGEAYPGDLVAFDAKDFPSDFPAKPASVVRLYTLRDGEWGASNYHGSRSTGSGSFSFLTTIPGHLKPGTYAFILRVIDTCSACNLDRPYVNGQCPPAECIQKVRQNFIQVSYDIRILDPKGRPGFHPGVGPFGFECSWTESTWNASREQYDHSTKTSATDCPSGARFHLTGGPFPLAFRDEFLTFYLRRDTPDASGHCPDGAMAGLGGNGGRHCYYHQYSPFAGRVCTPTPHVKSNCPNDRGAAVLCDGPDRPHTPGVKTNCRVDASNNLAAPLGEYELVIRNRWPSTAIDNVQAWEVAGQTVTITAPVKDPAPTYQQKQFMVSILRDDLKLDSPLVPQYVERGQLIAGTLFNLPIRWNPPPGESFKFPAHTMAIVLDANVRGDGGVVIAEGRVGLNASSWEPVNQLTWHNLKLPVNTTPGHHQLTVRCINCDERLTVADPAIGNRGRPVTYAPASIAVEVVDPANLPLPSIRVQPATTIPGKTITITGVHYPPQAIVTTVELAGRSGSRPLLTTYRRPPDDQYTLPVEGRPVTEWKPTIDLPVGSDGRFTITMTLPPTVGDLVLGRGEIRATVSARAGDWTFAKEAKVTIDASTCPITEKHATLTFVNDRDGATVSPGKPIDYGRGDGTRVEGKGFHCRSPLQTITATWRSRGKTFGPVTIPTVSGTTTPGVPFVAYGAQETTHDGTIGGGLARLIFSPNGLFWRGNYLDVDHALITIVDARGRTSAPARLDLALPYRAVLDPTWLRRERKGDAALKAGDWVKVHLTGFPTGHRVHVQHLNWEIGEEPIGDKNQSWNEALVDRMMATGRRLFIERNPDVVDLEIPKETPPGVQTFIFVDTTEGEARPEFLGASSGLLRSRGRTFLTLDIGAGGRVVPPEDDKKLPPGGDDVRTDPAAKLSVSLEPSVVAPGAAVTIRLSGFGAYSVPTITVGSTKVSRAYDYTDGKGALTKTYTIPPSTPNGMLTVTAVDTSGRDATATLTVQGTVRVPTITLDPSSGPAGVAVTIRGKDWDASEKRILLESSAVAGPTPGTETPYTKDIVAHGSEAPRVGVETGIATVASRELPIVSDLCAKTLGGRSACREDDVGLSTRIPEDAAPGSYALTVVSATATRSAAFRVTKPELGPGTALRIALDPSRGVAGDLVTIAGEGFTPNATILIRFDRERAPIARGSWSTDDRGRLPGAIIRVPNAKLGPHHITASDGRGHDATAPFELIPSEPPERPPPKPPTPEPQPAPTPKPEARYCDPNIPKIWQEGCVSRDKPTPAPDPKKETACDPNLPSFFVGACPSKEIPWQPPKTPTPEPKPQPAPPPPPTPGVTSCDPNIPKIWQGDCIDRPNDAPKPTPSAPAPCIPSIPKFSQPGCIEATRPGSHWLQSIASTLGELLLGAISTPTLADEPTARRWTPKILAGTYRCWNFNVGGGGGVCRNPPLELRANGTYVMSKERGSYRIRGETLTLSKSTFRGMGTISADGMQIRFQYTYRGLDHTVTYLRTTNVDLGGQGLAMLALTIRYPEGSDWLDWASAIELEEASGADRTVYTAIGNTPDREHLTAYYKKGVSSGRTYRVYVSTGTDRILAGTINLGGARGEVQRTIEALPLPNTAGSTGPSSDPRIEPTAPPTTQGIPTSPPTAAPTTAPSIPTIPTTMPSAPSVPRVPCDPNIPRYSQAGCVDPNDPAPTTDRRNGLVEVNIPTGLTNVPVVGSPSGAPSGNPSGGIPPLIAPLPEGPTWTPPANTETTPTPNGTTPSRTPTTPTPRKNIGDPWRDTYENEDTPIRNWYREHPGAVMGPPLLRYNLPSGIF